MTTTTFEQFQECKPVDRTTFKAVILGLKQIFCSEVPTESGRLMIVRDGEHGQIVGLRDEYLGHSTFYLHPAY